MVLAIAPDATNLPERSGLYYYEDCHRENLHVKMVETSSCSIYLQNLYSCVLQSSKYDLAGFFGAEEYHRAL